MQNLMRTAANALAYLADKAHQWADSNDPVVGTDHDEADLEFAGVDFVGIDFSTSIQQVASHVIHGWDRYRSQMEALRRDHGVEVFGVNAVPFPLTRGPVPPRLLPGFRAAQFQRRGTGPGLIEYGSAFYDYFFVALDRAWELGNEEGRRASLPITISLLCDGFPNGGVYRASDVRPRLEEARARGIRFKLVGFVRRKYRHALVDFRESLGLTGDELEVAWYDEGTPDEHTIHSSFDLLSSF